MTAARTVSSVRLGDGSRHLALYDWSNEPTHRLENLLCLDSKGHIVWVAQLPANTGIDCFVAVRVERDSIVTTTWSGYAATLDVNTGTILSLEFVK